jgi:ketosteroid isomerase-like protein
MSQADIETLRANYEAMSRGDWDAAFRLWHPYVELETGDRIMRPGIYRGPDEIKGFFEDLLEPFAEVSVEPEEFFDRGDRIVVYLLVRSRPKGSTATLVNRIGHLVTMRDGKAARIQIFPRREEALEVVGLTE